MFNDQNVNITDVEDVVKALKIIIENNYFGIFHVGSPDFSNPHEIFSRFLSLVEGREVHLEQRPMGELEEIMSKPTKMRNGVAIAMCEIGSA